jgi:hypothetical protein
VFRGSLPPDLQRIIRETTSKWPKGPLWIGCSGNLTIERTIADQGWQLHSNDVLLYTSAIGSYLAGVPLEFSLSQLAVEEYPYLTERFETPEERLATLMLCSRLSETLGKEGNSYYDRMKAAYAAQWPSLVDKTVRRIEESPVRLASFTPEDIYTWIKRVPDSDPVISYPPFTNAASAFERDFAKMDQMFEWPDRPEWELLTEERREEVLERIASRKYWCAGSNAKIPAFEKYLTGITKTTNRGVPIHVYASVGAKRIVMPAQGTESLMVPHIQRKDELGDHVGLVVLTNGQFSTLRSQYMNPHIRPGAASLAVGVVVDGLLVGCYAWSWAPTVAQWDSYIPGPHVYMLSDFPVSGSSYKNLAKLVLYAALSTESKALAERHANRRFVSTTTTAFSKNPVSMKYRGVMRLLRRVKNDALKQDWADNISDSDSYYSQPYELQYGQSLGGWSLDDGLAIWKRKHGVKNEN